MTTRCERYFIERLFWLPETNNLLHVSFMFGHGWYSQIETVVGWKYHLSSDTYAELMQRYAHLNPELLVQEVL